MVCANILPTSCISIHALREESDPTSEGSILCFRIFQSTLSVRRATEMHLLPRAAHLISIHALREESDLVSLGCMRIMHNFNPRSP